jgi:hypothetical protein
VFGLGRYFYNFAEMWVEVNEYKQPKECPTLPVWALPTNERQTRGEPRNTTQTSAGANAQVQKGPLDASITARIEKCRKELGQALHWNILGAVAKVRSARDIPNQHLQQEVLKWMESGVRGLAQIRNVAAEIPETKFYEILDRLEVRSLDQIPSFGVLTKLVDEMNAAQSRSSVA